MRKLTILVDMDDTIEDLLGAWVAWLNKHHGLNVKPEDIKSWDITQYFPLSNSEIYAPLNEDAFWNTVKPKDGAAGYLAKLKLDGHKLYIVTTSGYKTLATKMEEVLFKYFPFISWNDVIITADKQLIDGDVLVDDGVHNLAGGNYHKLLMDAPHNRWTDDAKYGFIRVHNWEEAYREINKIAAA